jgi:hypothetical protein
MKKSIILAKILLGILVIYLILEPISFMKLNSLIQVSFQVIIAHATIIWFLAILIFVGVVESHKKMLLWGNILFGIYLLLPLYLMLDPSLNFSCVSGVSFNSFIGFYIIFAPFVLIPALLHLRLSKAESKKLPRPNNK